MKLKWMSLVIKSILILRSQLIHRIYFCEIQNIFYLPASVKAVISFDSKKYKLIFFRKTRFSIYLLQVLRLKRSHSGP